MADLADPYTLDLPDNFGDTDPPPAETFTPGAIFGPADATQSPTTAAPAGVSWTGITQALPQIVRDVATIASTGLGISLAKDNYATQRAIAQAQGQGAIAAANQDANLARYRAQLAANQAALAARYPNGVPFGATRQDQIMILLGVAGLAVALLQLDQGKK